MSPPPIGIKSVLAEVRSAFLTNLKAGLALWSLAVFILIGYHHIPFIQQILVQLAQAKSRYGLLFSAIFGGFVGGILPGLILMVQKQIPKGQRLRVLLFFALFWIYRSMEVDLLYRLQAHLFGNDADVQTIIRKVTFDMLGYAPLWGLPTVAIAYLWKDNRFSFRQTRESLNREFIGIKMPAMLVSNWLIWIPAVSVIYSLPLMLQLPIQSIILCFFVMIINALSEKAQQDDIAPAPV